MSSNVIKLVIAAVLFVVAGVLIVSFLGDEESARLPDDAKLKPVVFLCMECGHHFELSYEEAKSALAAAPERKAPVESGGARARSASRRGLPKLITCQKCGQAEAVRAKQCGEGDIYVPLYNPDGTKGECP